MDKIKKIHIAQQIIGLVMLCYMAVILFQAANTVRDKIVFVMLLILTVIGIVLIDPYLIKIKKETTAWDIKSGYIALIWLTFFVLVFKFAIIP